jgi:hypothetical protein
MTAAHGIAYICTDVVSIKHEQREYFLQIIVLNKYTKWFLFRTIV